MNIKSYRIESIDLLRGMIMVIMTLDHVRDYFHTGTFYGDPTNLETTTPILFFTRWITHFCAPVFVFLAGTSAFLYHNRHQNTSKTATFLLTRGLWLIFLDLTLINFAWTFDVWFSLQILQVIWVIGISMVLLAILVFLPEYLILGIGLVMIVVHNTMDSITAKSFGFTSIFWYILHQPRFIPIGDSSAVNIIYPVIPWVGVMALGYVFGRLYLPGYPTGLRKKWLVGMGVSCLVCFLLLRYSNMYGDAQPWTVQKTPVFTFLSFVNLTKYPPSLLYLLMTLGGAFLCLYWMEAGKGKVSRFFILIGRVPLFFYILHLFLIHVLAVLTMFYEGRPWTDMILTKPALIAGNLATHGYPLGVVYLVWIFVIALLYPLCRWYAHYKSTHRGYWWLSYL